MGLRIGWQPHWHYHHYHVVGDFKTRYGYHGKFKVVLGGGYPLECCKCGAKAEGSGLLYDVENVERNAVDIVDPSSDGGKTS